MNNDIAAASNDLTQAAGATAAHETAIESRMSEELTDEQLLQMADRDSSWGANCSRSGC